MIYMIHYNNYKLPHGLEYVDSYVVRKEALCTGKEALRFMEALCKHLIAHPDPTIVPIYSFEYLGACADNTHKYQYDMMRLGDISEAEKQIIWQVGDAWRSQKPDPVRNFAVDLSLFGYKEIVDVKRGWEEFPKLMTFLEEMIKLDRYHDLHGENIMMDNDADYRIIDLEGFKNPPLSLPENKWITDVG